MDIYQATQALLSGAAGDGVNTVYLGLEYDALKEQWELPTAPAVTWLYDELTPQMTTDGPSGLYTARLSIDIWAPLETADRVNRAIAAEIAGKPRTLEGVTFTLVPETAQDVAEVNLPTKHIYVKYKGIIRA